MEYQRNKAHKPKFFKKSNRPLGFHGYYVEVHDGEDPMRAYRKMKKWIKIDKFLEEIKERQYFQKPSDKRQQRLKQRRLVLKRLQRDNDDNRFVGRKHR
jgi:ribosomal protein S21